MPQSAEGRWVTVKKEGPLHGRHILIDGHGRILKAKGIPAHVIAGLNGNHREKLEGKDMEPHLDEDEALLHPLKETARSSEDPVEWWMNLEPDQQKVLKAHMESRGKKMADLFKEWGGGTQQKEWKDTNPTAMEDFTPGKRQVHPHQVILGQQTKHGTATANADEDGIIELGPSFEEHHGYGQKALEEGKAPKSEYAHLGHILMHELGHVISTAHPGLHSHIMSNPQDALGRYNLRQQHFHGLSYTPEESWADAFASYHLDPDWLKEKHPKTYEFVSKVLKKIPDYGDYIKALDKEYQAYSKHRDRGQLPTREVARKIVAGRVSSGLEKSLPVLYIRGPHARVMPRKVPQVEPQTSTPETLSYASDGNELTLWHKTPTRNVESIMKSGLIPRYGKPTQGQNPAYNAVYFHTHPAEANKFDVGEPATLLKIRLPINDDTAKRLYPDEDTMCRSAAQCVNEGEPVAYRGEIAPDNIELLQKSLTHDDLLDMVDQKEHNHLTNAEIKQELSKGGKRYVLTEVNPRSLKIEDEHRLLGVRGNFDPKTTKPIIVGKDGFIIDGRHRAASAKLSGVDRIRAYVPKGDDLMKSHNASESELTGGEWRTIHGAHVYIKDGKVVAGADGALSLPYVRIHQQTGNFGKEFAQDIEPHGEYMSHDTMDGKSRVDLPNFEYGRIHFKKPLVMEHEGTGHGGWKTKLSERFGGKKGKALSNAIKKAGYDGIVTMEGQHILEMVNLAGEKTKHGEPEPQQEKASNPEPAKEEGINSLDDLTKKWEGNGASVHVHESKITGNITLSKVAFDKSERGQGKGTAFMNDLISYADKHGKKVTLTPDGAFGGTVSRLKEFYKRFGFVENKGRNKDLSISETFYREPQKIEKSLTGGATVKPLQPLLIINIEKSAEATPRKWYQDVLDAGGRWVTIKKEDSPLHGRHILINGAGRIMGGKGVPEHIIRRLNGDHIDDHKPYDKHGPDFDPDKEPQPEPAPAPEPPKEEPKGKGGEKVGYGAGATMHVSDGSERTIKHIKNLKHVHGGRWNADKQRWEFDHAHGSEGHKNLEEYAKNNGLNLNLIHGGEEEAPDGDKADKPSFKNEGDKRGAVKLTGNTYPHKAAIKGQFGAHWVGYKDANGKKTGHWQVDDVAHGGDLHEAMKKFAEERGLNLEHEHDEGNKAPEAPKEEPKNEGGFRDLSKESFEDMMKNPPTVDHIFDNLMKKYESDARYGKPDATNQAWIRQDSEEYARFMKRLAESPELHAHAKQYMKDMGEPMADLPIYAENAYNYARDRHKEEQEDKRRREELAKLGGKYKKLSYDSVKDLVDKSPSIDDLRSHFIAHQNESRIDRGRSALSEQEINDIMPGVQANSAEALNALEEMKKHPELIPHVQEYLDNKKVHAWGSFDPLEYLDNALTAAQEKVAKVNYKTADGKEISFNPNKTRYGHVKGARNSDHYYPIEVNGRTRYLPVPNTAKGLTKEHIAKWLEGAGDEAHSYVHHVLSGNKEPFTYQKKERVKPSGAYKPFAAPPEKNVKSYLDQAKEDMEGHGARAVVFNSTGTSEERAKTAHAVASGMRALSHLLGENMPEVELVIGGTKGTTLAHYRTAYRSITIDPKKGRNSFVHEFGHFLDDAIHGFHGFNKHTTTWGTYAEGSHLKELGDFLRSTEAAKKKDEETKKYGHKFQTYYKHDTERFARFFAQWVPHEAKKRGMDIPEEIYNPYEIKNNYGEAYTAEDLEQGGKILQEVLKKKGLWKGLLQFMAILAGEPTLYIKL